MATFGSDPGTPRPPPPAGRRRNTMGPWVREADDEEEDSNEGGRLRRVAGKRGVLVRQQRSLDKSCNFR